MKRSFLISQLGIGWVQGGVVQHSTIVPIPHPHPHPHLRAHLSWRQCRMMRLSEPLKFGVLALAGLLAAVSHSQLPYMMVTGILSLLMTAVTTWFCIPGGSRIKTGLGK